MKLKKLKHYQTNGSLEIELPKIWHPRSDGRGGLDVKDALCIYLADDEEVYAEFSLSDVIIEAINDCKRDGSYSNGLKQISLQMKELSYMIDEVLKTKP